MTGLPSKSGLNQSIRIWHGSPSRAMRTVPSARPCSRSALATGCRATLCWSFSIHPKSSLETTGRFCDASHSRYALVVLPNGSPVLGFVGPELMRYSASNFARPSRMSVCRARPVWYAAVSVGSISPDIFFLYRRGHARKSPSRWLDRNSPRRAASWYSSAGMSTMNGYCFMLRFPFSVASMPLTSYFYGIGYSRFRNFFHKAERC